MIYMEASVFGEADGGTVIIFQKGNDHIYGRSIRVALQIFRHILHIV